jgi:hypothetical protein
VNNLTEKEILVAMAQTLNSLCDVCTDTVSRTRSLEMWRSYITGGLAVIAIAVSIFAGFVLSKI